MAVNENKLKKDGTKSRQGESKAGSKIGIIGIGQPMKWENVQELIQYVNNFFEWCEDVEKRPTVTRLAYYLKCDRKDLIRYENYEKYDWLKRLSEEDKKEYSHTIKEAKRRIECEYEDSLFDKTSTTGAIFTLKNNYQWKDQQDIVTTNADATLSAEEVQRQLQELGYEESK